MMIYFIALPLSDVCNGDDVGKDSGGSNACSCAIAFDDHRIFVVTFGCDHDDVVAPFQIVEGMPLFNLL
jgi:hypothetical protein